jgi:hypothetical protein
VRTARRFFPLGAEQYVNSEYLEDKNCLKEKKRFYAMPA